MTTETKFGGQRGGTMLAVQFKEWAKGNGGEELLTKLLELKARYEEEKKSAYNQYTPERLQKIYQQAAAWMARMRAAAERRGIAL